MSYDHEELCRTLREANKPLQPHLRTHEGPRERKIAAITAKLYELPGMTLRKAYLIALDIIKCQPPKPEKPESRKKNRRKKRKPKSHDWMHRRGKATKMKFAGRIAKARDL